MIYKKLSLLILFFATGLLTASAQKSPQDMDRFIDVLMNKMTHRRKDRTVKPSRHGRDYYGTSKAATSPAKSRKAKWEDCSI